MESQYQKWVNLSYLAIAALVAYIFFTFTLQLSATFDWETRVRDIDTIVRVGSIGIGALVFFILFRNEKANVFMNEVAAELARVTWPTQKETSSATFIVIVMVMISGLVLGFLDYVWTKLLQQVL
jgi:preprotein translocase subunit SecE